MDDFDVKHHDRELDDLLSEVKGLLGEEPEQPEEDSRDTLDAPQKAEEPGAPMTADDVNIDFEKFYDDAAGFPDEGIYTPPTAYEQSKSAYQVARRAEYDRVREAEREARDRQRVARDREEERMMRKLEGRGRKTAEKVKNPPKSDEEYAKWLYEQGVEPETEDHREYLRQREQQTEAKPPKKRRGHGFLKVVLALVLVLAIALGSVHFFVAKQPEAETGLGERKAGCATILIAGTDEGGYRTDTMMLFSVNRATGKMSLVSIPRDTLIYCEYSVPKINSAYGWASGGEAGMEQLLMRVEEIIGFRPDGYVLVDLSVFEKLVDTMGGVTFNVPVDMHYEDPSQGLSISLTAGEQHLDGAQAMQVVRFRSGYVTQDLGRVETQRAFLSAALKQWTSFKGLIHLPAAFQLVLDASKTDLTTRELVWLCESAVLCSRGEIDTRTLPGEASYIAGGSYYVLDAAGVCETINACCNPYQQAVAVSNLYIRVG